MARGAGDPARRDLGGATADVSQLDPIGAGPWTAVRSARVYLVPDSAETRCFAIVPGNSQNSAEDYAVAGRPATQEAGPFPRACRCGIVTSKSRPADR